MRLRNPHPPASCSEINGGVRLTDWLCRKLKRGSLPIRTQICQDVKSQEALTMRGCVLATPNYVRCDATCNSSLGHPPSPPLNLFVLNADMEKFRSFPSPAFLLANVGPGPSRPSSHGQANRILAKAAEIGFALQCSFLSERFRETRKAAGCSPTRESRNLL